MVVLIKYKANISENERLCNEINHVKQVFKEQFDSIKKTRVRTKEQSDSLIDKLNLKSAENEDLKAQIQDKVFVITSLKNDLQKLKGKEIVDIAAQIPSANTIVPGMFKLDLEPLAPSFLQLELLRIHLILSASQLHSNIQLSWLLTRCIDNLIVFSKLSAVNGFEISLPVAVCSGVANALVQHYGALITIQFLVNCQPLTDLRSLYQSRLLWTSQFLMSVRHGELMTICCVVAKPTLKQSFSTPLQLPDTQTIP
ncbi:hypothetical protein Tco_0912434 [Tanacetum coccineum]